ncbi:50S ribosomal protein L25/general stress protein Ctc [Falsiroseomonas selenitidurans]|uniref:Large ribosomal subunit protein bL25 n=1 Tax=Falsiroseomonas selenitidurans TaxID=2716335 RepID=A0ABX1EAX0_9PROT|nr:50S ribosomal protein L25/general stress protein Ctc [Falsiroseomonas selenitidurans]NKC33981.1 50S ribosomal protein L25/general stress protein Ctc [Falsiroseomonas selenitidurans]
MVQTVRIEAVARDEAGKGAARATRREGLVPGVVYGAKQKATLVAFDPRDIMKELIKGGWQSHLYEVAVKDGPTERTIMREVQFHPVTDRPIHIDFQRVAPGARIRVRVPVVFLNEDTSAGLKAGGVLNVVRREVEVLAETDKVPDHFEIDLLNAKIGDGLRWSAIKDHFGARPGIVGRDFMIASIAAPMVEEEVAPVVAAPEPAKGKGKAPAKAPAKAAAPAKGAAAPAAPAKKK